MRVPGSPLTAGLAATSTARRPELLLPRRTATTVPVQRRLVTVTRLTLPTTPPTPETSWQEHPGCNAVTDRQRVIVLAAGTVHVLDGIAATIWHHPQLEGDLLEAVVTAEHGAVADASALVTAAATALVALGLRERV